MYKKERKSLFYFLNHQSAAVVLHLFHIKIMQYIMREEFVNKIFMKKVVSPKIPGYKATASGRLHFFRLNFSLSIKKSY